MLNSIKVLLLYSELADYLLSSLKSLNYEVNEIHVVHWPVNKEAPFKFNNIDDIKFYDRKLYNYSHLVKLLKEINPAIILCSGWIDKDYIRLIKNHKKSIPTILLFDNPWRGAFRQFMATLISPFTLKKIFTHCWLPGSRAKVFAQKLGFSKSQILTGLYSADTPKFSKFRNDFFDLKKVKFPKVFLYVGRYVKHKGLFELWNAFIELQDEDPSDWELWCLGTGEEFENRIIHPKIKHFGFIQPSNMINYLSKSGVYILPSIYEPWGVSVHEMASAGFPMLLSENVGSSEVFLKDSLNGYFFKAENTKDLKDKMRRIIDLKESELLTMCDKSYDLSLINSPKIWANKLISLL